MEPSSILVLRARWSIEEHDVTFVPALIRFLDVGEIERCQAIRRVLCHPRHTSFVAFSAVGGIIFIPNKYRYILTLEHVRGPKKKMQMKIETHGGMRLAEMKKRLDRRCCKHWKPSNFQLLSGNKWSWNSPCSTQKDGKSRYKHEYL